MDFQNYDDYMRNTLGFSSTVTPMGMPNTNYSNINCSNMCMNPYSNITSTQMWQDISCNLEKMYPDSYNAIYPMISSVCRTITLPITEDTLNSIVNDIYDKAVNTSIISVDVNNREEISDRRPNNLPPRRPHRNKFLNDFIKVLLLRELINRHKKIPIF